MEHRVIGSGTDMRQATACKGESKARVLYGISLRISIPAPPVGLVLLSIAGNFLTKVYCLFWKT